MRFREFAKLKKHKDYCDTCDRAMADCICDQEQLDELSFMGSQCTKDCSGHRAGYAWYKKKGYEPASWSRSFNNGAAIAASGR